MTSRMLSLPVSSMTRRSRPKARPPCGGTPYWKASSRKPKRLQACSLVKPSRLNILLLQGLVMDTDAAAAQLGAVQDDVVGFGPDFAGIGVQQRDILVHRAGERMMHGHEAVVFLVVFEQREFGDPEQFLVVWSGSGRGGGPLRSATGRARQRRPCPGRRRSAAGRRWRRRPVRRNGLSQLRRRGI